MTKRQSRRKRQELTPPPQWHSRLVMDTIYAGSRHCCVAGLPADSRVYSVHDWAGGLAGRIIDHTPYPPLEIGNASSKAIRSVAPHLLSFEPQRLLNGVFTPGPRYQSAKRAEGYLNGQP